MTQADRDLWTILSGFLAAVGVILLLSSCAQVQQFAAGDLSNAAALATKGNDPIGAMCWTGLGVVFSPSAMPATDGLAMLAERKRLAAQVVSGACGAVIAPALLQDIGKIAPAPFNLALPF